MHPVFASISNDWVIAWYIYAMRTTIDSAGRLVVPKTIRDELGFGPGQTVELTAVEGRLEVEVPATPMVLVDRDGVLVAEPKEGKLPPLSGEVVRMTLEHTRR
jgi:AbrB family looped-hinge helix DNA binding protein